MNILVTGANGYIGRRLIPVLVRMGHRVTALVRDQRRIELEPNLLANVTVIEGDLLKPDSLNFPTQIDAAYYLVHSMASHGKDFSELERTSAENFLQALAPTNANHIIYLSGIVNDKELSKHLSSRKQVEDILFEGSIPVTVLRAAIIIGSGGASFEIIRDLVEKLPVMVAPKWVNTRCQPIAIRNVIEYLAHVLLKEAAYDKVFDIGGPEILTYKDMMLQFAEVRGYKRYIVTVPVLSPRLSSLWLYFVTSTSFSLARSLVDSMVNEVIVQKKGIDEIITIKKINYKDSIRNAYSKIEQNEIISSWKDALASSVVDPKLLEHVHIPVHGCFVDKRKRSFDHPVDQVLDNIWSIGGGRGWYYGNWLWQIRGFLDQLWGGVGLRRGRRSVNQLVAGDALDFWRVLVADRKHRRLLLYAEMKLPGEAWLEFKIRPVDHRYQVIQTATFRPDGIWGRIYWAAVYPFHGFIFRGMLKNMVNYTP